MQVRLETEGAKAAWKNPERSSPWSVPSEKASLEQNTGSKMNEISEKQQDAAQKAFEQYDFGDGVQILDHNRWQADENNGQDDWIKVAYAQFNDDPADTPSRKISFHAKFDKGTDRLVHAYAYLCDSGQEIGFLPDQP